jgi:multidrug efflux pump subunit AcrA (membrane-fusion protein)
VALQNLEKTKTWSGKVSRINGKIDQASQTVQLFIEVKGGNLREGMYLEANVPVKTAVDAIEVNRKLLIENKFVYVVKDSVLDLVKINTVHFNENTVVVKGLKNDMQLVSKPITGAYAGMPVKIFSKQNNAKTE